MIEIDKVTAGVIRNLGDNSESMVCADLHSFGNPAMELQRRTYRPDRSDASCLSAERRCRRKHEPPVRDHPAPAGWRNLPAGKKARGFAKGRLPIADGSSRCLRRAPKPR